LRIFEKIPSLCLSQGACARNLASSPHFLAVSGHDVLWWLLISSKAFCGYSSCFFVVGSVATMWACFAWLWLGIICGAESANRLYASRWSRLAYFQCWPCSCIHTGCALYSIPCTGLMAVLACPCPSLKGWYCACKGESRGYWPVMCARACICCCHKGRASRWAGRVLDVDDVSLCPTPMFSACCSGVLVPLACVLESQTLQNTWAGQVVDEATARGFLRFAPSSQVVW